MATTNTTRKAPGGARGGGRGDPSADRSNKDRRVRTSSTAGPTKSGSRPLSAAGSPEKTTGNKSTPNYLRSTASSRHDVAAKKPNTTASKKKLTGISSMDRPHPPAESPASSQQRRVLSAHSLKEPTTSKALAAGSRASAGRTPKVSPSPAARQNVGVKIRSQSSNLKNKKKEVASSASMSGSPRGANPHHHLDFLETRSEPDVFVAPVAKLTPEDDADLIHEDADMKTINVEECRQIEEHVVHVSEEKQEVEEEEENEPKQQEEEPKVVKVVKVVEEIKEETQSSNFGRPKSFTHKEVMTSKTTTRVDDELRRKLMKRQAWEADKDVGSTVLEGKVVPTKEETTDNANSADAATAAKKESSGGNEAIEEAASKLSGEKKKKKVLALVGAFETVMSFHKQPETPSQAKAPDGESAFDREVLKQEGETKEGEEEVSQVSHLAEEGNEISNNLRSEEGPTLFESRSENAAEEEQTQEEDEEDEEEEKEEEKEEDEKEEEVKEEEKQQEEMKNEAEKPCDVWSE